MMSSTLDTKEQVNPKNPLLKIIKNHVHPCNRGRKSRAPHMPLFMYRCPIGCNPSLANGCE
jgi:hypothetical protein